MREKEEDAIYVYNESINKMCVFYSPWRIINIMF